MRVDACVSVMRSLSRFHVNMKRVRFQPSCSQYSFICVLFCCFIQSIVIHVFILEYHTYMHLLGELQVGEETTGKGEAVHKSQHRSIGTTSGTAASACFVFLLAPVYRGISEGRAGEDVSVPVERSGA